MTEGSGGPEDNQLEDDQLEDDQLDDPVHNEWPDEVAPSGPPAARAATVVGMLGVGSLPAMLFCGLGTPMAVLALALAPSARRQVLRTEGREGGLGLIRVARICSVVSLVIAVILMVVAVFAFHVWLDWARRRSRA